MHGSAGGIGRFGGIGVGCALALTVLWALSPWPSRLPQSTSGSTIAESGGAPARTALATPISGSSSAAELTGPDSTEADLSERYTPSARSSGAVTSHVPP